ncbi:hypothetical protein T4D_4732 [Trichinella pseudospiralis]|uniref:Uncharacterized protein n=1 Tax=Trichinella pseudospiralis TaxID=6337 RepID=A0A0V1G2E8_TRIPS|nr:hypothetical protein T4D_4732 [Trichinella pseudospiralis]
MITKRFLLISLIFSIRINICKAVITTEQILYTFQMMVQDWFNESQTSNCYYVVQKVKGTVLYEDFMSTEFEFKRSNCTKQQVSANFASLFKNNIDKEFCKIYHKMPAHLVRREYGCFSINSEDLKHIMKCTILHKGFTVSLQSINNFAAQCHNADINALYEIEKLFPNIH